MVAVRVLPRGTSRWFQDLPYRPSRVLPPKRLGCVTLVDRRLRYYRCAFLGNGRTASDSPATSSLGPPVLPDGPFETREEVHTQTSRAVRLLECFLLSSGLTDLVVCDLGD